MEAFETRELSFSYPGQARRALDGVSLRVERGDFVVLFGPSGGGKTTLLRCLKPALTPAGEMSGGIFFYGKPLSELDERSRSAKIGFVMQSPEAQIVTDKVWHELAFGLESLGMKTPEMRRRVAEMAGFFGLRELLYRSTAELSGGQKQLLCLASIMAMQPEVLLLDEPTGSLDPIAASGFLSRVAKINRELGTTVILTEHRLEEALPLCSRAVVLDRGRVLYEGEPLKIGEELRKSGGAAFSAMPAPMRVWFSVPNAGGHCPLSVRDGREWLYAHAVANPVGAPRPVKHPEPGETVLSAEGLWFRYEKDGPDILRGLSLTLRRGELLALLGGNGEGKTTCLELLAGLSRPYRGEVGARGRIGLLPQEVRTLFVKRTLREDLYDALESPVLSGLDPEEKRRRLTRAVSFCGLSGLLDAHPYDLSGGEAQRAGLAKLLLMEPDILLLDEPTRGLDAERKARLAAILSELAKQGRAVLMVSHDTEFCAEHAHRCALLFDGCVTAEGPPEEFFDGGGFYTTAANRMSRGIIPGCVTAKDIITACGGEPEAADSLAYPERALPPREKAEGAVMPLWRKITALLSGCAALFTLFWAASDTGLSGLSGAEAPDGLSSGQLLMYGVLIASLLVLAFALGRGRAPAQLRRPRQLSGRTVFACCLCLALIPLTLFAGTYFWSGRKYYFIALLLLLECMAPFFLAFEGRQPRARELAVIAVLCAIAVAGRAAFFMLPQFKPVLAVTIIAGVALGGETGFLVGAVSMLASNMIFAQGPWTPWQMFAMGLCGLLAGLLSRIGLLRGGRAGLCVFGAVCAVFVYGGIMNPASALMWNSDSLSRGIILAYYAAGLPLDLVHAAATALFLWFGAEPSLAALERVRVKYGLY